MSYVPTVWIDHVNSGNCYNIYNNDDGTKEIVFAGQVLQQGTPMSAENFNHMENGIVAAQTAADNNATAIANVGNTLRTDETRITFLEQQTSNMYNKSEVLEIIVQKIAEIVAGAPEEFNTLKEMSDWLIGHEESAAAMNTAITKNTNDISKLESRADANDTVVGSLSTNLQNAFTGMEANAGDITRLDIRLTQAEDKVTKNILAICNKLNCSIEDFIEIMPS